MLTKNPMQKGSGDNNKPPARIPKRKRNDPTTIMIKLAIRMTIE